MPDQPREVEDGLDRLLRRLSLCSPREAAVFLLDFDHQFERATGREPTAVQALVVDSLLRRRAAANP